MLPTWCDMNDDLLLEMHADLKTALEHLRHINGTLADHEVRLRGVERVTTSLTGNGRALAFLCSLAGGVGAVVGVLVKVL